MLVTAIQVEVIRAGDDVQSEPQLQEEAPEQPQSPFILMVLVGCWGEKLSGLVWLELVDVIVGEEREGLSIQKHPQRKPGFI